jgi:hypothetical protein
LHPSHLAVLPGRYFNPKPWTDHPRALLSEAAAGTERAGFAGAIFGYVIKLEEMRLIQFFASFTI